MDKMTKAMQSSAPIATASAETPPILGYIWWLMLLSERRPDCVLTTVVAHQQHQPEDGDLDQQDQTVPGAGQPEIPPATARACTTPVTISVTTLSWATFENLGMT